jgi:hypothetical protein
MNSIPSVFRIPGVLMILLAVGGFGAATASQAQIAAPAVSTAQSSFCGSQALCYETADFAATITDFRTSTQGYYKIVDVIVRFQNKTNHPLGLGYVAGSGTAMDDRGNRYIVYGANGFRGIGQVYGTNFDPKFNLAPGGFGDAQFELMWAPGQTVYGLTFELNLTVDEINTVDGNQRTLGGEFPLHYRGLANGASGAAPGQATAFNPQGSLPPCGPAATALGTANSAAGQTAAGANTAVSNAAAAFSNLGSLFGKKKAAAPAAPSAPATNTASAAPCAPAATTPGAGTSTSTSVPAANGTVSQPAGAGSPAVPVAGTRAVPVAATKAAPIPVAKSTATPATKPVATVAKAPAPPATTTVKKTVATPTPQKPAPVSQ